jgi:hypothetical protein
MCERGSLLVLSDCQSWHMAAICFRMLRVWHADMFPVTKKIKKKPEKIDVGLNLIF